MNIKFFCINMKSAKERRRYCEQCFGAAGVEVHYVEGIDSKQLGLKHDLLKTGKIGCYLSYLRLYEEIARNSYGVCVLLEDDVQLVEGFKEKLHAALASLPNDWETAYIGWWPFWWNYEQLKIEPVNDRWLKVTTGGIWGGYGQVINGAKGAAKLMDVLATINGAFDEQMHGAVIGGRITGYYLKEPIVHFTHEFPSQTWT